MGGVSCLPTLRLFWLFLPGFTLTSIPFLLGRSDLLWWGNRLSYPLPEWLLTSFFTPHFPPKSSACGHLPSIVLLKTFLSDLFYLDQDGLICLNRESISISERDSHNLFDDSKKTLP